MIYFYFSLQLIAELERGNLRLSKKLWKNLVAIKVKNAATNCT
jgi:hypothetical protein